MAANTQPNLNDLLTAFFRSVDDLRRNEKLAAWVRLALLLACLLIGSAGPALAAKRFMLSGSWLLHSLWFLAPAVIGITLAIISLGQFVTQMYGLRSLWHGIRYVISTTFGLGGTTIIAKHGEIEAAEESEAASKIGGPATLSVKSGTAVVTERGSGFARMLGPGQWHLHPFERICNVIDLRTQSISKNESALTKDGIPVKVQVSTAFKIAMQIQDEVAPSPPRPGFTVTLLALLRHPVKPSTPPLPASPEALRLATYDIAAPRDPPPRLAWNTAAHGTAAGEVREALARKLLDQLFAPDDLSSRPREDIGKQAYETGKASLAKRGIDLLGLSFDNLGVPHKVVEQRRETWEVNWEKETCITQADGESEWLLLHQRAHAEALAELIQAVTQAIRTQAIRSVDETGAGQPAHPLALRFADVVAHAIDTSILASSRKVISQSTEDILKPLRKKSATDGKTLNRG